jgi:glycerate kinase
MRALFMLNALGSGFNNAEGQTAGSSGKVGARFETLVGSSGNNGWPDCVFHLACDVKHLCERRGLHGFWNPKGCEPSFAAALDEALLSVFEVVPG